MSEKGWMKTKRYFDSIRKEEFKIELEKDEFEYLCSIERKFKGRKLGQNMNGLIVHGYEKKKTKKEATKFRGCNVPVLEDLGNLKIGKLNR